MSWTIKIEVVGEEQADAILEVLREAEEEVELEFSFNTSKTFNGEGSQANVEVYFEEQFAKLGMTALPFAANITAMPIESVCGMDCKVAIDSAVRHGTHLKATGYEVSDLRTLQLETKIICEVYING